jgi:hypothetical protein
MRNNRTYMSFLRVQAICFTMMVFFQFTPLRSQSPEDLFYQKIREEAEQKYEPSADLLNGVKYHYPYRSANGTPFLEIPGDPVASVRIRGREYENQRVRYDMYNQIMVLDYLDGTGARGSLVLKNEWLEQVVIGETLFRLFKDDNGTERFGQVIGEGEFSCIYFWEKQYLPDLHNGEQHYFFGEPSRRSFLRYQESINPYKGNRSLIRCFPDQIQPAVKGYLKEERIRVKKATDREMQLLLDHIHQLPQHEE